MDFPVKFFLAKLIGVNIECRLDPGSTQGMNLRPYHSLTDFVVSVTSYLQQIPTHSDTKRYLLPLSYE